MNSIIEPIEFRGNGGVLLLSGPLLDALHLLNTLCHVVMFDVLLQPTLLQLGEGHDIFNVEVHHFA